MCVLSLALTSGLWGDDIPSDPPDPAVETAVKPPEPAMDTPIEKRVFGVLPNYRTVQETGVYAPIGASRKLAIATRDATDAPVFLIGGLYAVLGQWRNQHPAFGQGVKGLFHRYATSYADQAAGTYLTEGILPVLTREDPRYFRRGKELGGSVPRRVGYAVSRIFVTRTDSGATTVNYSELIGNGVGAGIANAYYPAERRVHDDFQRWGVLLGTDAVAQILREISPDLRQRLFRRRPKTGN